MLTINGTVIAGLFGNALEWYDFILYANFAPLFASIFFTTDDHFISLVLTFIVFAAGFIVRPLGGVVIGHVADRMGRRTALITSISIITLPTFFIGFLPTYNSIGWIAPILLMLLRLMQGIAVGGELNTAANYLVEHAPSKHRGLAGCLVMGTQFLGMLFGALVTLLLTIFIAPDDLQNWGWRIAFWFGGILGVIGFLVRLRSEESPMFREEAEREIHTPIKLVYLNHRMDIFLGVLLCCIIAAGVYLFIAYVVTFLTEFEGFSFYQANAINLMSMLVIVLLFPVMGMLSDKFGRKPIFNAGLASIIILAVPIFWLLSQKNFTLALVGDLLLCLTIVPVVALIPTILAEMFPMDVRNTGTALAYNISLAAFGGTTPLIALGLVRFTGSNLAPAGYFILMAIVSSIALYFIEESHHRPLK